MYKLIPPCSYQGGKQKIASQIVDYISNNFLIGNKTKFFDLCCGSGAISLELISRGVAPSNIYMVDASPWGWFYNTVGNGVFDINEFAKRIKAIPADTKQIKPYVQSLISSPPNPYDFLILQASAHGSTATWIEGDKWCKAGGFRDYWLPTATSNRRSPVNPMMPMPDTLLDRTKILCDVCRGVHGYQMDVFNILPKIPEEGAIIYIDPPYDGTCQYGYNFNLNEFMSELTEKTYCPILVSEAKILSDEYIELNVNTSKGMRSKNSKHEYLNIFL